MIYLNIKTNQRTKTFIDDDTTIPVDDVRIEKFFQSVPNGYKRVLNIDTYDFEEILPLNEDGTVNLEGNRLEELAKDGSDEYFMYYNLTPDGEGIYQEDTAKSSQDIKDKRIIEIDALLGVIDAKKVRPLSAIAVETNQDDINYLSGLNAQSGILREERETLI